MPHQENKTALSAYTHSDKTFKTLTYLSILRRLFFFYFCYPICFSPVSGTGGRVVPGAGWSDKSSCTGFGDICEVFQSTCITCCLHIIYVFFFSFSKHVWLEEQELSETARKWTCKQKQTNTSKHNGLRKETLVWSISLVGKNQVLGRNITMQCEICLVHHNFGALLLLLLMSAATIYSFPKQLFTKVDERQQPRNQLETRLPDSTNEL